MTAVGCSTSHYVYVNAVDKQVFGLCYESDGWCVGCQSKEDDETHTPIVLSWQSGGRGGRGSYIRVRGVACRRDHGCRCSGAHTRPCATTKPSTDGYACRLKCYGARLFGTTVGGQQIGASASDRVDGVMVHYIGSQGASKVDPLLSSAM